LIKGHSSNTENVVNIGLEKNLPKKYIPLSLLYTLALPFIKSFAHLYSSGSVFLAAPYIVYF
jgi:hypothetical protein